MIFLTTDKELYNSLTTDIKFELKLEKRPNYIWIVTVSFAQIPKTKQVKMNNYDQGNIENIRFGLKCSP